MRESYRSVALRLLKQNYQDIERIIEFDFVRATVVGYWDLARMERTKSHDPSELESRASSLST